MNYIRAEGIAKSYGEKILFENLDFFIEEGNKMALIARNGSGKSSLLNCITGLDYVDEGKVNINKQISIGYLPQEPKFDEKQTVLENIFSRQTPELLAIKEFEAAQEAAEENGTPENLDRLQHSIYRMDELKAWVHEATIKTVLTKLNIHHLEQPIKSLSGGQRKRVALAHILIEEPDLLILDEPTNHLDIDMVEWLENYLSKPGLTMLLVTHDRYFLDNVTNEIVELDRGKLYRYRGNYQEFLEKKEVREFNEAREVDTARNLLRKELAWMRKQPKARTTKSKSRIDNFYDLKDRAAGKKKEDELKLSMKMNRIGGKILELKKVYKNFGEQKIMAGFDYTFKRGERIGIVGKNGVGKSTFLNIITGETQADSGKINTGETVVYGYYGQKGLEIKEDKRVIEVVKDIAEVITLADGTKVMAAKFCEMFQFTPEQQFTYVSRLSGGEKRRLYLLTVLVKNPNFLILDEPTNDLDLITLQSLEQFLESYNGCLIVVSHDRYFMDKLVDHLFIFEGDGVIKDFAGNYSDYRESLLENTYEEIIEEKKILDDGVVGQETNNGKSKAKYGERLEYNKLEKEIKKLEKEKNEITEKLSSGNITDHFELNKLSLRIQEIIKTLDDKTLRWLELSELM